MKSVHVFVDDLFTAIDDDEEAVSSGCGACFDRNVEVGGIIIKAMILDLACAVDGGLARAEAGSKDVM